MGGQTSSVERFKASIGYDKVTEPGGPNSGVVVVWSRLDGAPQVAGTGWRMDSFELGRREDGAEGQWIFKKGDQTILVRVFVSSRGVEPARRHFLEVASATTMLEIPYKKTAKPIGTLSVTVPGAADQAYLWFFHNVCFYVWGIDTDADVEGLARWVQAFAAGGLIADVRPHLPPLDRVEAVPRKVSVTGTLVTRAILAKSVPAAAQYTFTFRHDEQVLDMESEEENAATFRALRPGRAQVRAQVVDTRTLLASEQAVVVDVTP